MLEIILAIYGLYILVAGKMKLSATKVVEGAPARLISLIMIAPLPLSFAVGLAIGIMAAANGQDVNQMRFMLLAIEVLIVIVCAIAAFSVAHSIAKPPGGTPQQFPGFGPNSTFNPPPADPKNPYHPPSM